MEPASDLTFVIVILAGQDKLVPLVKHTANILSLMCTKNQSMLLTTILQRFVRQGAFLEIALNLEIAFVKMAGRETHVTPVMIQIHACSFSLCVCEWFHGLYSHIHMHNVCLDACHVLNALRSFRPI